MSWLGGMAALFGTGVPEGEGAKRLSSSGDPSPTPAAGERAPIAQEMPSLESVGIGGANWIGRAVATPALQNVMRRSGAWH
jgi:hypothetical protein